MSRGETVVNPSVLGAARRQSFMSPGFQGTSSGAFGTQTDAASRQSDMGQANGFVLTTTGAPPAGFGGQVYQGRSAYALTSGTNAGHTVAGGAMFIGTQRSAGSAQIIGSYDFAIWELSAILAFDALPGNINATGQLGLSVGSGNYSQVGFGTAPTQAGFFFGPIGTGILGVTVRTTDGGAIALQQSVATGNSPDHTKWHRYAIRILSASGANEAQAKFLVDGLVLLTLQWGAGTVLPSQLNTFVAPRIGFTPAITNVNVVTGSTTRMYVANNSFQIIAAPTEDALL